MTTFKMNGRTIGIVAMIAALAVGSLALPADAKKKKKKPKPTPTVAVCAPYTPGELGTGAETSIVTDEATAEAPVEATVATAEGLGFSSPDPGGDTGPTSHAYHNVQVDSAAAEAGLYVRVEFTPLWDYDLYLRDAAGTAIASVGGFNQAPEGPLDGTGNGGHSEMGAEQLDGIRSADCAGYTIDIVSAGTPGEDVTVKMWLGEPTFP